MNLSELFRNIKGKSLAAPIIVVLILGMMILPIPPFLLDVLFTFNIALSIIVLLTALYTVRPLDFMVFPTVLLVTTILRLALNVASTRVVLSDGHTGPGAAGKVIESFGNFLIAGDYLVGAIVFIILTIINFVVITKGAGRIAEVGARFALDAMPGKQMAIDADLNAGMIGEAEARKRRTEVGQEAEFYGAMDGASKYVRGDAVAGIIITIINIVGGVGIGMLQHNLAFSKAIDTYLLLAIGDGLVAQIPSLIISLAAGAVVSRVASDQDIGSQLANQVFMRPEVLYITAIIIGSLGLIPGMPNFAFLLFAGIIAGLAYQQSRRSKLAKIQSDDAVVVPTIEMEEASWKDVSPLHILGLEVGYRLINLVDKNQNGELLRRIKGIRKKFAQEIGFLPPTVHIRDNLELRPNAYRITLKGVEVGFGESNANQFMAINPGMVTGTLPGTPTKDPAFGLDAIWIDANLQEHAQSLGYTVVDAGTVIATHLNHIMSSHAAELLGRQEVQTLVEHIGKESTKFIEDLVPKVIPLTTLQKVLQNLLEEGVHIRDIYTIIESISENIGKSQDPIYLTSVVRIAIGRAIVNQISPGSQEIPVMTLDTQLEKLLMQAISNNSDESAIEPGLAETLTNETSKASRIQEDLGFTPILLVPGPMRNMLSQFLRRKLPQLKVLSHSELPSTRNIRVTNLIGALG
jgi:flagellar biosynthesis protein FlhA